MEKEKRNDGIKRKIKEYWNRTKKHAFFENEAEEKAWWSTLEGELGGEKLKILDVGTGNGSLALLLSEMGHSVVGIDISEEMLSVAREKADKRGVDPELKIGDAESPDFEDESFDVVVSRIVLWTLPHPETAVGEWWRVLKPGGRVYEFGARWSGGKGLLGSIKENLGKIAIAILEQRNAWSGGYDKKVNENLPLSSKEGRLERKLELFRRGGFTDVDVLDMEEVNKVRKKNLEEKPLRYRLSRSAGKWYCIKGRKSEK